MQHHAHDDLAHITIAGKATSSCFMSAPVPPRPAIQELIQLNRRRAGREYSVGAYDILDIFSTRNFDASELLEFRVPVVCLVKGASLDAGTDVIFLCHVLLPNPTTGPSFISSLAILYNYLSPFFPQFYLVYLIAIETLSTNLSVTSSSKQVYIMTSLVSRPLIALATAMRSSLSRGMR